MGNNNLTPDSKLLTVSELNNRIKSINNQIENLDNIFNPRNFDKHHKKYCSLVQRRETLCYQRDRLEEIEK